MIIDSVEEIIRHKNIARYEFFKTEKYHDLLEQHERYYTLTAEEEPRMQTLFNHLNRVLGTNAAHVTEVVGNYNTFKILIGIKQDDDKVRELELLVQNSKTSEIIGLLHVFRVVDVVPSAKTPKYNRITTKEFFGRITLYDGDMKAAVTNEFGVKFINGLISIIFTNRGLPDLNIRL